MQVYLWEGSSYHIKVVSQVFLSKIKLLIFLIFSFLLCIFAAFTHFHFTFAICEVRINNLNTALVVGLTAHSLKYLCKIILAEKMHIINEPCYCEVLHWQSAFVKRSSTIFSVMLSNLWGATSESKQKMKISF